MNKRYLVPALSLALIALPISGYSKQTSDLDTSSPSLQQADAQGMQRVSKDQLQKSFTAQDLIGKEIKDIKGETIGSVSDVSLPELAYIQSAWPEENGASSLSDLPASDSLADAEAPAKETMVYISVGGLLGIGDDIVAVPAKRISFDHSEKQYFISADKQDVVALAKDEPAASQTLYSAKQTFVSDVEAVRSAFKDIEKQAGLENLTIEETDGSIVLSGNVDSESSKRIAEKVARNETDMEIQNNISVSQQ